MILTAEYTQRSTVYVDTAKFIAHPDYAAERADFAGTDDEFVLEKLRELGICELLEPCDEDEWGVRVVADFDDDYLG